MLAAPAAAEEVLLQEENAAKRNKKEKKKNSSGRLELGTVVAGGASNKGEWRDTLLRSIAAFLESNGFARTLSTFQSEASIEFNHQKTSAINLEDLLCKFFESSNDPAEKATIVCLQNQGNPIASFQTPGKSINTIAEQYPKKKRKKTDEPAKNRFDEGCSESVNLGEITDGTSDEFHVKDLLKENGALKKSKTETKEKKRKTKSASDLFGENSDIKQLDGTIGTSDTTDLELANPCVSKKESKKKKHKNSSDVAMENVEIDDHGKLKEIRGHKVELRSVTNGSSERKDKTEKKKEKKVKDVQPEVPASMTEKKTHDKLVDAENSTLTAVEYSLNDKDSQRKEEKKKCNLTPEGLMEPGKLFDGTDAKKKNDIQQDVQGIDLAKASTPVTGELDSKVGKKNTKNRKRASSAEEKDNLKPNNGLTVNMKTDETNADVGQHLLTKKLKREEGKGSDKLPVLANAEKGVDEQIPNGSVPDNNMEEKETNKDKKSKEPKSVTPFQRVKVDEVKFADQRLQDNSYWAKGGADSGYGAKAQEVLGQVRGRDFRHEKTKKKRGTYRGGLIDLQSHSIKFTYSDED